MKIELYLYDSTKEGYKGKNYSSYILQGNSYKEDITQELDTANITLYGLDKKEAFLPETRFIYIVGNEVYDLCVEKDLVEKPNLAEELYKHSISFIEPSVIAQKRIVDNISATYKIKDVAVKTKPTDIDKEIQTINTDGYFKLDDEIATGLYPYKFGKNKLVNLYGKYFKMAGYFGMVKENGATTTKYHNEIHAYLFEGKPQAKFLLPNLIMYYGEKGETFCHTLGACSIDYTINEYEIGSNILTYTYTGVRLRSSELPTIHTDYAYEMFNATPTDFSLTANERRRILLEGFETDDRDKPNMLKPKYRQYTNSGADNDMYTDLIPIKANHYYKITIKLHDYEKYNAKPVRIGKVIDFDTHLQFIPFYTADETITAETTFSVYDENDYNSYIFKSAIPYSAYDLICKAVINSGVKKKQAVIPLGDINYRENGQLKSNLPFYIDDNFVDELKKTTVIESFFYQKNLWEILLEVGHYIHAVPELRFGEDDRYMITFSKLGRTDEKQNRSRHTSIMNFRGVEDYISSCTSYVENMVQLNGMVDEYISAKTNAESYLIYNDTAVLKTSKPIIELLQAEVIDKNGNAYDITDFIFEENVYKILDVSYLEKPNKGIALFYRLGENKIDGLTYRSPTRNTGDKQNDYAIKKVIYCAINGVYPISSSGADWVNINVNDYVFHVKYNTKDNVRQTQTRPDIRKYLLTSKYDDIPTHYQFNNQGDILVDSEKFGNNIFGKLIRTGNLSYNITEYNDNMENLKHKGELYRINGDIYYVKKAHHTFFSTHVLSDIEYSKDYNELSPIVGIPSEPRFYEISEQSVIKRDVSINDYLIVSDDYANIDKDEELTYIKDIIHLSKILFGGADDNDYSKYVITAFKGETYNANVADIFGEEQFYKEVLTPVNAYSSQNTLTYQWDMLDNFSAGDSISKADTSGTSVIEDRYKTLSAVRYTDKFGKASLFDFYLLKGIPQLTIDEVRKLPNNPLKITVNAPPPDDLDKSLLTATNVADGVSTVANDLADDSYHTFGLSLLKDCREKISFSYNIQLLSASDTFVFSPFLFESNKANVQMVLLNEEVNKLSYGYIDTSTIIREPLSITGAKLNTFFPRVLSALVNKKGYGSIFKLVFNRPKDPQGVSQFLSDVADSYFDNHEIKAIAFIYDIPYSENLPYKAKIVMARNIPQTFTKADCLKEWFFGAVKKDSVFKKKQ